MKDNKKDLKKKKERWYVSMDKKTLISQFFPTGSENTTQSKQDIW
jgi:hypothetical protein